MNNNNQFTTRDYINNINADIRKYHYWRGFIACSLFIVTPLLVGFIIFCHTIISKMGGIN